MSQQTASPISSAGQASSPPARRALSLRRFRNGVAAALAVLWFMGAPAGFLVSLWVASLIGAVVSQSTH